MGPKARGPEETQQGESVVPEPGPCHADGGGTWDAAEAGEGRVHSWRGSGPRSTPEAPGLRVHKTASPHLC